MKRKFIEAFLFVAVPFFVQGCARTQLEAPAEPPLAPTNLAIAKVGRSSIADYYEASGTVKAKTTTHVSANLMGRIISFPASEGDTVVKGQTLVEIDNRDAQAQLQKAQAALREAEASISEIDNSIAAAKAAVKTAEASRQIAEITFGRYKELYARRSVSGQEYDDALSKLRIATSELERAKANVRAAVSKKSQVTARVDQAKAEIANTKVYAGYSRIVSPVSGVIVKKLAESGSIASPGVPLLSIEDNSLYRLEVAVEESRSKLIHIGNRVNVRIDALGPDEFFGTIAEILPAADASSRSYTVKVDLARDPNLRSGLYGLARFPVAQKEAITVPESALQTRGQLTGVYVVGAEGTAQFRIVIVGKREEGVAELLSGLSEGDDIVISDIGLVKDGMKVR